MQRSGFHSARHICILAGATLLLALGGCATNFDGAYRFAGPEQPSAASSLTEPTPPTKPPAALVPAPEGTPAPSNSLTTPAEVGERALPKDEIKSEEAAEPFAPVTVGGPPLAAGSDQAAAADATGAGGSWVAWLYERLKPWIPDLSSPEAIMGDLTASAAYWVIRGLSLSPTVRILSVTAVVLARPLVRWFFEWLGGGDDNTASVVDRPTEAPLRPGELTLSVTPVDREAGPLPAAPPERRLNRIGCCDVF